MERTKAFDTTLSLVIPPVRTARCRYLQFLAKYLEDYNSSRTQPHTSRNFDDGTGHHFHDIIHRGLT